MRETVHHVSSAIVATRPGETVAIAETLSTMAGVEVHASVPGKIVVVIEGPHAGALGETLIAMSAMPGVIAAHMVFEQALNKEETGDDERTDAA